MNYRRRGQSLVELMLGVAVGTIFIIGAATVVAPALQMNAQGGNVQAKAQLGQDLMNNVQAWATGNWTAALALGTSTNAYLNTSSSPFTASTTANGEQLTICNGPSCGTYLRYFYFTSVYRDSSGNATTTASGNYYDPSTMLVTVVVKIASSTASPFSITSYVTRSVTDTVFAQTSWGGGTGQSSTPVSVVSSTYAAATNIVVNATGSIRLTTTGAAGSCSL